MTNLLTAEDSKRVADALIAAIGEADLDIGPYVRDAFSDMLLPRSDARWREDWFPRLVEELVVSISDGVVGAAYDVAAARKERLCS